MMITPLPTTDVLPTHCNIAVIGSGAGGAVTAAILAEGGQDTVILEEGNVYTQQHAPFSMSEMLTAYRRRGMTVALGKTPVNYAEACCVGGGSEINSGLYHRPPTEILQQWATAGVYGADSQEMMDLCDINEKILGLTPMPGPAQPASQRLASGAHSLGLSCKEIPRWHQYDEHFSSASPGGIRQSMSRTFLPRFIKEGGRIVANCKAHILRQTTHGWKIEVQHNGKINTLMARHVFIAAGAIGTPILLRRSGFRKRIGSSLRMHVFTRVIAEFPTPVNGPRAGIGPHQVDGLVPRLRLGCGVATPAHLAAAFAQCGNHDWLSDHNEQWPYRSAYYATIGGGRGWVRNLGNNEVVFYRLSQDDYYDLADGVRVLCRLLLRAGARKVLPIIKGAPTLTTENQLWRLPRPLPPTRACLTSVHLMGSCPMGNDGAIDSFGAVRDATGLYVADASLFCHSPNVNPQGTVMAFAHRHAKHYLLSNP